MATTTINTTGAEDARISPAFGDYLNLGRNATAGEIKSAIGAFVKDVVRNYEVRQAYSSSFAGNTPIAPT